MIFGVVGACRGEELTNMKVGAVTDNGNEFIVHIPERKTKTSSFFTINGRLAQIVRKYVQSRPENVKNDRFFLNYRSGKCLGQVIGKNTIANMPKNIAKYFQLPEPKEYTAHSYRRTSTTVLADSGEADIQMIKRHGQWKSTAVAEGKTYLLM